MPKPKTAPNPSKKKPLTLNPVCKKKGILISVAGDYAGGIDIKAKNAGSSTWWYLLKIRLNGTFMRQEGVPVELGFQLDSTGRIVLDDGDNI